MHSRAKVLMVFAIATIAIPDWCIDPVGAQVVTDGLVSYWTFDDSDMEGDIVKDVWGNNHGTIHGARKVADGKIGGALRFDGNDFVNCGDDPSLDITDEITIEAWIKLDNLSAGYGTVVGNWTAVAGQRNYIMQTNNDKLEFFYCAAGVADYEFIPSATSLTTRWTHVVSVLGSDDIIRQYINGEEDPITDTFSSPLNAHVQDFFIGRWAREGSEFFRGLIDEVKIYNRTMSGDEIQQNYEVTTPFATESAKRLAVTWAEIKSD